ncbi:MAG: dynamin family protein [Verrucomicrobiota bacterium]|nr:dynamin family protein [Verrucomicrobiota bacterium]
MDDLLKLERNVRSIYARKLSLLASRYRFNLPVSDKDVPGSPRVLFLGNHSSGKSSFINYIAGADIQESGIAPTDDGFTLVTHGEEEETLDGQTLVSHPELDYQELASLGPEFLAKLRFKTHPSENLRQLTLIDSPGMIDSASSQQLRSYDFRECVRRFAESADLILFFFDPDKPGTTGEAISIFTSELVGLDHKLLIVLNKVDLFDNIRDFARTYGTLCWNLSKTIPSKDTPRIYTTYLPGFATRPLEEKAKPIPLEDFDISRDEVVSEIMRAPARRADNLVSGLLSHANRLSVHVKVCLEAVSAYRRLVSRLWLGFTSILLLVAGTGWLTQNWWFKSDWEVALNEPNWDDLFEPGIALGIVIVLATLFWWILSLGLRNLRRSIETEEGVDVFFKRAYRDELSLKKRADLYATWESIKPGILDMMRVHGLRSLSASASSKKLLRKLEAAIDKEIPSLRRRKDPDQDPNPETQPEEIREPNDTAQLSTEETDN